MSLRDELGDYVVNLDLRSCVCDRLYGAGIERLGHLVRLNPKLLEVYFNFSDETICEITQKLKDRGLSLGMLIWASAGEDFAIEVDRIERHYDDSIACDKSSYKRLSFDRSTVISSEIAYHGSRFYAGEW